MVGDFACIAAGTAVLRVIDVSDPTALVEVDVIDTPGFAQGVSVVGDLVYVSDTVSGLRLISTVPEHPVAASGPSSERRSSAVTERSM